MIHEIFNSTSLSQSSSSSSSSRNIHHQQHHSLDPFLELIVIELDEIASFPMVFQLSPHLVSSLQSKLNSLLGFVSTRSYHSMSSMLFDIWSLLDTMILQAIGEKLVNLLIEQQE